jgi:hypothetical protein
VAQLFSLGGFERMQNMNALDLADGTFMSLLAIYFLLGLFSDAPWLHTDGKRKAGHWVVVTTPRFVRVFCILAFGILAVRRFVEAFHRDSSRFDFTIDAILLAGFLVLFFIGRKSKHDNDPAA